MNTLHLVLQEGPMGPAWFLDHTGTPLEAEVVALWGTPVVETAFLSDSPADNVIAYLSEQPAHEGYRFEVVSAAVP